MPRFKLFRVVSAELFRRGKVPNALSYGINFHRADFWPASPAVPLTHDFRFARYSARIELLHPHHERQGVHRRSWINLVGIHEAFHI